MGKSRLAIIALGIAALVGGLAVIVPWGGGEPAATTRTAPPLAPRFEDVPVTSPHPSGLKLSGRVLDATGRPVPGATVALASSAQASLASVVCPHCERALLSCMAHESTVAIAGLLHQGRGLSRAGATAETDGEGRFSFEGLSGVSFTVWASAAGLGSAVKERAAPGDPVEIFLPPLRAIVGTVKSETGARLSGAHVHAISRRLALHVQAEVQPDGRFELGALGEGPFYVVADAPGHLPTSRDLVEAGAEPLELELRAPRTLEVRVLSEGRPVEAQVQLESSHDSRTLTATDGLLRLSELAPGELTLTASARGKASVPRQVEFSALSTQVTLELEAGGQVLVTVVDERGEPVPKPEVTLLTSRGEQLFRKKAATGELVSFGPVGAGDYLVEAWSDTHQDGSLPVKVTGGEVSVELVLASGTVISGKVIDEYERPAPGVSVLVGPTGQTVYADQDGAFVVQVPTPGLYTLHAHHSDWGGGSVQVQAPAQGVRLALEPRGGVAITVESNGRRVEGAEAVLWLDRKDVFRNDRPSGPDGIVTMRGMPAGSYWMLATHPDHLPSDRQRVEVVDGQLLQVTVQLRQGARLSGEVVDESGAPVQGAFVTVTPRSRTDDAVSDGRGHFELRALRPGAQYVVEARHDAYEQLDRPRGVAGGEPVKVTMRRRKLFHGRVVAEDGAPVRRFTVDDRDFASSDGSFEVALGELDGRVLFTVEADGFEPQSVERPAVRDLGEVRLRRAEQFDGLVKDPSGQPVGGAVVTCDMCDETVVTSPDGRFKLGSPGMVLEFTVSAKKGLLTGSAEARTGQPLVEVVLKPATRLSGTVYGADGQPAAGEEVEASSLERSEPLTFVTDAAGRYSLEVPPGQYRFAVGDQRMFAGAPLLLAQVSGPAQRLDLGAVPGSSALTFKVQPRQGYALWVVRGRVDRVSNPPSDLNQSGWAMMMYQPRAQVVTLAGFPPGRYSVVWGSFHSEAAEPPRVIELDVPATREVDLTAPR